MPAGRVGRLSGAALLQRAISHSTASTARAMKRSAEDSSNLKNVAGPPPLASGFCLWTQEAPICSHRHWQPARCWKLGHTACTRCAEGGRAARAVHGELRSRSLLVPVQRLAAVTARQLQEHRRLTAGETPPPPDRFRSRPLPPGRPPPPRTITGSRGGLALPRSSCARSSFSPSTSHVGSPARLAAISAGC